MKPVTDPALLQQLNAAPTGLRPVTDPSILRQLEPGPDPTEGNTFLENAAIGAGKGLTDLWRGAQQIYAKGADVVAPRAPSLSDLVTGRDPSRSAEIQAEIDESRKLDAPLMRTAGGVVGNIAGTAIPALAIPGAGTYLGATAAGIALGAAQPVATGESRLLNTVVGGAGGAGGKLVGDVAGKYLTSRLANAETAAASAQARNAERDAVLRAAQAEGAVVPPRMVQKQGPLAVVEGFGGKIKTEQQASNINQEVWNRMGRRTLGITDDTPITPDLLKGIRAEAGKAYQVLRGEGRVTADNRYREELAKVTAKFKGASEDFPDLAKNEIADIVASVDKPSFSTNAAIDAIDILRTRASAAYGKGDKDLGKAFRMTSSALEDAIERALLERGPSAADAVKAFQSARRLIAKTYSVESALTGAGDVSAAKLGGQLAKGKPLTEELKTIAQFAQSFPKASQSIAKVEPTSVLDVGASAIMGSLGGLPAGMIPLARPAARALVLSKPYQSLRATPSYDVGSLTQIAPEIANHPILRKLLPALTASTALHVKRNPED